MLIALFLFNSSIFIQLLFILTICLDSPLNDMYIFNIYIVFICIYLIFIFVFILGDLSCMES